MRRLIKRFWSLIVRAEEAYAIYWWLVPMIPGGLLGWFANLAGEQPHMVALFVLVGYAVFTVGQYFVAMNVAAHSIKNRLIISAGSLDIISKDEATGLCTKAISVSVRNKANVPLELRTKATLHIGNSVHEDDDFDPPAIIAQEDMRYMSAGPISELREDSNEWRLKVEFIYSKVGSPQKFLGTYRAKKDFGKTFKILEMSSKHI